MLKSSLTSWGTNTAVGSSKIRIFAPLNRTFIISTLCFSPTPNSSIIESVSKGIEYFLVISLISFLYLVLLSTFKEALSIPKIMLSKTDKLSASIKCW